MVDRVESAAIAQHTFQRLAGTATVFAVAFAEDGDQSEPTSATVTVTRSDGTALATGASATKVGSGASTYFTWTLSAANNTRPDLLRLDWTDDAGNTLTTFEEVVGSLLYPENAIRGYSTQTGETPFSNTTRYPDSYLAAWRQAVAEDFEQHTGRSWIERHARIQVAGNGRHALELNVGQQCRRADGVRMHRPGRCVDVVDIIGVSIGGTAQTVTDIVSDGNTLHHTTGVWSCPTSADPLNVIVEYTYGMTHPTAHAQRMALRLAAANMVPEDSPSRATSFSNEDGTFRISTYPTDVEDWLRRNDMRMLVA